MDHIGVCIPTFKRPELLAELLHRIAQQESEGLFSHSVHVIDNDTLRSAEATVREFAEHAPIAVTYEVEPVQNIALARNRAVRCAHGNFIAFIDDDERPVQDWLLHLYSTCVRCGVDGVLGPVRPDYGPDAPQWLKKSRLCERPSHTTGTILTYLQTRTGNVLFRRDIVEGIESPFPPDKGRTGGEDIAFFRTMMDRGYRFAWCEQAPVYELITPDRYTGRFYVDRSLRIGGLTGEMLKAKSLPGRWPAAVKSGGALCLHGLGAVAGALAGTHIRVRHAAAAAYHFGRLCGSFGFVPVRYRRES